MRFIYSLTSFLLLISVSSVAQHEPIGKIEGHVFDSISGETLPAVNINLVETKYRTLTNIDGYFVLDSIPEGKYVISLSWVGYEVLNQSVEITKEIKSYKFYLKSARKIIDPVFPSAYSKVNSIVFKQKYSKNGKLKKETKKTVAGDGARHEYVYEIHKYNYKNQLFESINYRCRSNMDTLGHMDTLDYTKYTFNNKKQIVGIESKTYGHPYTKESLYYDNKGKIIKREISSYTNGVLESSTIIQFQYTYDENGTLILEEETINGRINDSKKYK